MADLSKVKVLGTSYNLKDAQGRADLAALITSLGTAAYEDVLTNIDAGEGKVIDAKTIKEYVDAQVGAIHKFDVKVVDTLPTASADTMYILYLVPTPGATDGSKDEYITIRSGAEGAYTYDWELIGSTKPELSDYVKKTQKIAGIDMQDDITVGELQEALNLGDLAYLDGGSVTISTADGITMNSYTPSGDVTLNEFTQTSTVATISAKADYTPAGSITGEAISGGSINVTLKDQSAKTEADLSKATFTPAGTIAAVDGGDFQALKSATFQADSTNGVQIEGSVSAPAINLTSAEKEFATGLTGGSVAALDTTKFSGGSFTGAAQASFTQGSKASFTQGSKASFVKGTAIGAAIEGIVANVGAAGSEDAETLILSAADTHDVIGHTEATFTANGDDTFVANGDDSFTANEVGTFTPAAIADGFFTPNELQSVSTDTVNNVTAAALANAPVFTGSKYGIATTEDTALKAVAFTATNSADIVTKVEYVKQDVDAKTFTPVAATLGFSGTKAEQLIPTEVKYDKATANGASFEGDAEVLTGSVNKTDKTVDVDFE